MPNTKKRVRPATPSFFDEDNYLTPQQVALWFKSEQLLSQKRMVQGQAHQYNQFRGEVLIYVNEYKARWENMLVQFAGVPPEQWVAINEWHSEQCKITHAGMKEMHAELVKQIKLYYQLQEEYNELEKLCSEEELGFNAGNKKPAY